MYVTICMWVVMGRHEHNLTFPRPIRHDGSHVNMGRNFMRNGKKKRWSADAMLKV